MIDVSADCSADCRDAAAVVLDVSERADAAEREGGRIAAAIWNVERDKAVRDWALIHARCPLVVRVG